MQTWLVVRVRASGSDAHALIFDSLRVIVQTLRFNVKEYMPDRTQEGGAVSWQS